MRLCVLSVVLAFLLCFVGWALHSSSASASDSAVQKPPALYMLNEVEERAEGVTITRTYTGPIPPNEALMRK